MIKTLSIIFFLASHIVAQYIPIDSVRRQDANGVPLLLGQTVTVRGVVTMSFELGSPLVYFQDPTGGLVGYDAGFWNGTNQGDSVQVTGVVAQFNGLTELQPVNSFTILATNVPFSPRVVTCTDIRVNGETYEGQLIRINGVTQVKNTSGVPVTNWNVSGSGTNYRIFVGSDSCEIRIYGSTNIANSPIPPFPWDVIALASQFDPTPPYTSGYQILPRSLSDFILTGGGPLLSAVTYTDIQTNSVTITWQTNVPADSRVRWQAADSNYQIISYTDSLYSPSLTTNHSVTITNLQPGRIYYFNVSSTSSGGTTTSPQLYFCTASGSTGQINVYFNRSVDTTLHSGEPANGFVNFQTRLKQRIDNAQHSIDMCLYSLNDLTQIRDALINAKIRGVKIRFVYDSRTNQALVNDLIAAGIPIIKRPPSTELMHNKFFIFDYRYNNNPNNCWVWTGSTNITNDQFFNDANNVIEIQDRTLCAIYTREFEEMWGSATDVPIPSRAKFGPSKSDNVPHILNINGKRIEVYFSPGDNPSVQIENTIATQTDQSLYFAIYSFTRCNIHNRMKSKFDAGKDVRGVFDDAENTNPSSVYKTMKGLTGGACPPPWSPPGDVWLDNASGMLHHKYIIIDSYTPSSNPVTITGSFNFSNSATFDNDENFLIVYDSRVANLYLQEFAMRYRTAGGSNPIGIIQIADELPRMYNLYQNYPNPFNPETSIEFDIPEQAFVILSVYDVTGREIEVLLRENLSAGRYQVRWNAVDYPSGVYYYRLITDGFSKSGKMILIK